MHRKINQSTYEQKITEDTVVWKLIICKIET